VLTHSPGRESCRPARSAIALVINIKTAKVLDLVPPNVLALDDEVIE
jgi:hypothetical protein